MTLWCVSAVKNDRWLAPAAEQMLVWGPNKWMWRGSECLSWVCGVHYQEGSALGPTIDVQKHSLKFTVREGGVVPVFYSFPKTPSILKAQYSNGTGGRLDEKRRRKERMRVRNQGFKEGDWEEKRRGESALDSVHCLDVNWSWSTFCRHRKQQVPSA